ncbi:hypothetical protein [Euzebya tangerina]|uniref:hypothetical protein n=1 Tax=Euzebya tangerina TaxID=591198 RepID=UPI000E3171DB|nr:hypothetical protein [Euzebya tangerina]
MSVRVNLLPRSIKQRERARRANALLALLVLAFIALLVLAYFAKRSAVQDAADVRDAAQMEVNDVQAQVDALGAFQGLADELAAGNASLMTAMDGEIAVARLMNDVALSLPSTSSLVEMTVQRTQTPAQEGAITLGSSVANMQVLGYSIERYAPGVEGVLLQFDQVNGLVTTYLNTAQDGDIGDVGVTEFDATGLLTDAIYTQRYADGLPEVSQ